MKKRLLVKLWHVKCILTSGHIKTMQSTFAACSYMFSMGRLCWHKRSLNLWMKFPLKLFSYGSPPPVTSSGFQPCLLTSKAFVSCCCPVTCWFSRCEWSQGLWCCAAEPAHPTSQKSIWQPGVQDDWWWGSQWINHPQTSAGFPETEQRKWNR